MKDWIVEAFVTARTFVAKYIGEIVCGAIAIGVLILPRWLLLVAALVAGGVIFIVNRLKA
jgi:hypothetical protein